MSRSRSRATGRPPYPTSTDAKGIPVAGASAGRRLGVAGGARARPPAGVTQLRVPAGEVKIQRGIARHGQPIGIIETRSGDWERARSMRRIVKAFGTPHADSEIRPPAIFRLLAQDILSVLHLNL